MAAPTDQTSRTLRGKCCCGDVRYLVQDEFIYAANCHCSNCRRTTGSAFKPFAGIEREKLFVTQGDDKLKIFGELDSNNTHCATCGSLMYSVVRDGAYVHVAMGTLVDEIFAAVKEIREAGMTVLIVEQRMAECLDIADRAYILQTGRVLMQGSAAEIGGNPDVRKAYLGL